MNVFTCSATVDRWRVKELIEHIGAGYSFSSQEVVAPGENTEKELSDAISQCDIFIYFLSPTSVSDKACQAQLSKALKFRKRIIPVVLINGTAVPQSLSKYAPADISALPTPDAALLLMRGLQAASAAGAVSTAPASAIESSPVSDDAEVESSSAAETTDQPASGNNSLAKAWNNSDPVVKGAIVAGVFGTIAALCVVVQTVLPALFPYIFPTPLPPTSLPTTVIAVTAEITPSPTPTSTENPTATFTLPVPTETPDVASSMLALAYRAERMAGTSEDDLAMALALEAYTGAESNVEVGRILAELAYRPRTVRLYPLYNGGQEQIGGIRNIALSNDGKNILIGSDGSLRLADFLSGRTQSFESRLSGSVLAVALSPDGHTALSGGSSDHMIRLWDVATGSLLMSLPGHADDVTALAFSPAAQEPRYALSGSSDTTVRLWNLDDPSNPTSVVLTGHNDEVTGVAFNPDGKTAISVSADASIILWDLTTVTPLQTYIAEGTGGVTSVVFSPDGLTVFWASLNDRKIHIMNVSSWLETGTISAGDNVMSLAISPDGTRLVGGSLHNHVYLWDVASRQELLDLQGHLPNHADRDNWIRSVAFTPDGSGVLAAGSDQPLRLWRLYSGAEVQRVSGHEGTVLGAYYDANSNTLLTAGSDSTLIEWNGISGPQMRSFPAEAGSAARTTISADGRKALSAVCTMRALDGTCIRSRLILWDIYAGNMLKQSETLNGEIVSISLGADGHSVAVAVSPVNEIRLWDWDSGSTAQLIGSLETTLWSVAITPDGKTILAGTENGTVTVWGIESKVKGQSIGINGYSDAVASLTVSSDGEQVLASERDGAVFLWELATGDIIRRWELVTGEIDRRFEPGSGAALTVSFSRDGQFALVGGCHQQDDDGSCRLGELIRLRIDVSDELVAWIHANVYVPTLTCADKMRFNLDFTCGTATASP